MTIDLTIMSLFMDKKILIHGITNNNKQKMFTFKVFFSHKDFTYLLHNLHLHI
jgi:hypothetical protein